MIAAAAAFHNGCCGGVSHLGAQWVRSRWCWCAARDALSQCLKPSHVLAEVLIRSTSAASKIKQAGFAWWVLASSWYKRAAFEEAVLCHPLWAVASWPGADSSLAVMRSPCTVKSLFVAFQGDRRSVSCDFELRVSVGEACVLVHIGLPEWSASLPEKRVEASYRQNDIVWFLANLKACYGGGTCRTPLGVLGH